MLMPIRAVPDEMRKADSDAIRRRALDRLYMRKAAVDELIESLENYVRTQRSASASCIPISDLYSDLSEARKWS